MVAQIGDRYRLGPARHRGPNIARRYPLSTRVLVSAACLTALLGAPAAALAQGPRAWEEIWSLEVSRGASAPLVWADSLILVSSLDRNLHLVAAGDPPRVVWEKNFDGGFETAPVLTDDRIYLAETRRGARLVALDRRSRTILWSAKAGDLVAPPIVSGDRIYTVSSIGEARAFDPAGTELWLTELEARVVAAPLLVDGSLLIAGSNGMIFALDPDSGELIDSKDPAAGPIWGDPVIRRAETAESGESETALYATLEGQLIEVGSDLTVHQRRSFPARFYSGPIAAGEKLFLAAHDGAVYAYDWERATIDWERDLPGTIRARPVVNEEIIAVGDLAGMLYVVDRATGELLWHTDLDDAVTSQALLRRQMLYVMTESGTLYAFRPTG